MCHQNWYESGAQNESWKRELYTVLYIGKCVFDTVYRVCVMYRLELVYRVLVCLYYTVYIMHISDSNAYTIHITYIVRHCLQSYRRTIVSAWNLYME